MASILLRDRQGRVAATVLVDDEDFAVLSATPWCRHNTGYAKRRLKNGEQILMHRQIMGGPPGPGLEVDHINRCRLDNRRYNLRWVTRGQNIVNAGTRADSQTQVKHVHRRPLRGGGERFRVSRCEGGKLLFYPGSFPTIEEAVAFRDSRGKAG